LPHLRAIHSRFPTLRIVLEHATTRAAVECVKSLGDTVACTITAHHLALTVDDWAGQSWHFCKPVAKFPDDRLALREVIKEGIQELAVLGSNSDQIAGHPRFFLGSDSAPHPPQTKSFSSPSTPCAAGVYTSPILLPLVAHILESIDALDRLENFVSGNGRQFYHRPASSDAVKVRLEKVDNIIPQRWTLRGEQAVPFWAGKTISWKIAS
jgi:dihydroorotase